MDLKKDLQKKTSESEYKSESMGFKSKSKSESFQIKSESESESSKNGLESGLESKSELEYYTIRYDNEDLMCT